MKPWKHSELGWGGVGGGGVCQLISRSQPVHEGSYVQAEEFRFYPKDEGKPLKNDMFR